MGSVVLRAGLLRMVDHPHYLRDLAEKMIILADGGWPVELDWPDPHYPGWGPPDGTLCKPIQQARVLKLLSGILLVSATGAGVPALEC